MFRNYLKITLRHIRRHKGYSFINIVGLAIGMACCILILLWVQDELSFDRFHENKDQIFRVVSEDNTTDRAYIIWRTSPPLGPALKEEFPEILNATRFSDWGTYLVRWVEQVGSERGGFADPAIFEMFTFPFIKGDPNTALNDPTSVVITESMARKYFGDDDPLNQTVIFDNRLSRIVKGVIKDVPRNSSLQFDFLVQFVTLNQFIDSRYFFDDWDVLGFHTYVLLPKDFNIPNLNQKIADFHEKHEPSIKLRLFLQPFTQIYLHSVEGGGPIIYVYIFSIIAIFILMIACINFMNLSTARSASRAREVGLRKMAGACKRNLILQFYCESMFMALVSLALAMVLVELFLPSFNAFSGKELTMSHFNNQMIIGLMTIAVMTGLISGSYPAFFLSSFQPAKILKDFQKSGSRVFRKSLVVVQFSLSIMLIICTMIVSKQLGFIRTKDIGFNKSHLVFLPNNNQLHRKYDELKSEFLKYPDVSHVTRTSVRIGTETSHEINEVDWVGKEVDKKIQFHVVYIDFDFVEAFQMEMVQGRHFSKQLTTDTANVILNEEAVRRMGLNDPVGKRLTAFEREWTIIGVVKDFHLLSVRTEIEPIIIKFTEYWYSYIVVRINADHIPDTINHLRDVSEKLAPSFPCEYSFLDDDFDALYRSEQRMGQLFRFFAMLAVCISCLGLFGLASFTAEQSTKEIGIRKVLGASVVGVVVSLSKEFTKWVFLANIIAWPVAYFVMVHWLQSFAYQTQVEIWIFLVSAALALVVALLTVSYQAIKAALANPVDALKDE